MSTPMYDVPEHFPMGVTADGHGPADDDEVAFIACWCGDPQCVWTRALAAERAAPTRPAVPPVPSDVGGGL